MNIYTCDSKYSIYFNLNLFIVADKWVFIIIIMETFKKINWYENYKISDLWNIINKDWKFLTNQDNWNGYKFIRLYNNWNIKKFYIHRLVLWNFIWKSNLDINHKDWNKSNNYLLNLEYCSKKYNSQHRFKVLNQKWTNYWRFWKFHNTAKQVKQFDLNWNFIKIWNSIIEAKKEIWIKDSWIWQVCKWKQKTCWWFIWKY